MTVDEAAKLLECSVGYVRWLCEKSKLPGAVKRDGCWQVPLSVHPKFSAVKSNTKSVDSHELLDVPANKRDEALRRLGIIRQFETFVAGNNCTRTEALALFVAADPKITTRSLERWIARYRSRGLAGLVDKRGIRKSANEIISPDAFELFRSMYLSQQQLSVKTCWQNINFISRDQNKNWIVPSLAVMYRLKDEIPLPVQVLHREGLAAYEAKCAPYIEADLDGIEPGQVWVGDHSQFNCWIRYRGKWIRPWITAWQDMRSRKIVGRYIVPIPNQTTILVAMKSGLEKYGPPDSVKIDNGKDYDSECWTGTTKLRRRAFLKAGYIDEQMVAGIYAMMDIAVSFSIKYHPQSKPIERFFDTLDCQFTKTIPTYCGKDTKRRPEQLKDLLKSEKAIREAYDLQSFTRIVDRYIEVYNTSAHTGKGMDGRSPAEVFSQRSSRRVLVDGVLDLLMRVWSGELTVGKNGVRFKGIWYGQYNTDLIMHQGKKVRVAYDPTDLRTLYIYDAATLRLITIAEQNQLIHYGDPVSEENLREAMHRKSRAIKTAREFRDSRLTANMDLTDLTIRAMQEGREKREEQLAAPTLRPVRTPLDGQVAEHERLKIVKAVKKAAGAEGTRTVLDIDFAALKNKPETIDLGLFHDD